jgi:lysophospholipase
MAEGGSAASWHTSFLDLPDGVRLRLVHWPPPATPRATVLLLHGRTEFNEKYEETAGDLIALGFDVWSFDWRGQGLSTRLLDDRQKGHVDDYGPLVDGLQAVIDHVRRTEGEGGGQRPLVLLAHSMGGLVAMRYVVEGGSDAAAVVLSAPLLGIGPGRFPAGLVAVLAWLAVLFGRGDRFAATQRPWRPGADSFEQNVVTTDRDRYAVQQKWFRDKPELVLGGVTWGWLNATIRACGELFLPYRARRVSVPLLFALAGDDVVVSRRAIARMASIVPGAVLKTYAGARHELLMERDEVRDAFLADIDAFLKDLGI